MLSPLDDYPVHQISEPMRHVGTSDRNFYDRYYFNIFGADGVHGTGEELFAVIGIGQYPNLGVSDAFLSVLWSDEHRVVRVADARLRPHGCLRRSDQDPGQKGVGADQGQLRTERMGHRAGRGLRRLLRSTSRGPPFRSAVQSGHLRLDSFCPARVLEWQAQSGCAEVELTPERYWGSRDRSWGIRPVGEPEPPGIRATDPAGGFFWIYAPVRFGDQAHVTIVQERPSGERIMQDAHRVFPLGSGRDPEWLGRPEHTIRFVQGTRMVESATLTYFGAHGRRTAEVEVQPLLTFPLLLGTGYGFEPDWRHGMYQGELVVQGQSVPPSNRPMPTGV